LDTLWLMGMKDEFNEARDWIDARLSEGTLHNKDKEVSVFETTIRNLGGYLAAYDWSGDKVFLDAATDLADRLLPAFDSPSGLPYTTVNLSTGSSTKESWTGVSEAGTLQIEFRYLAKVTGKKKYAAKVEQAFDVLRSLKSTNGLYHTIVRHVNQQVRSDTNSKFTLGARADSLYEYMLKLWIQGGKKETKYRLMYDESVEGIHDVLLHRSKQNGLVYVGEQTNGHNLDQMDHLACFFSGVLALGAYTDPNGLYSDRAQRDLTTSKALAYTCYQMYASTETGLAPEIAGSFEVPHRDKADFTPNYDASFYLLRPEVVESLYILNKLTGDPIYREWGWEIFQSIEKYCKAEYGYGENANVNDAGEGQGRRLEEKYEWGKGEIPKVQKKLKLRQIPTVGQKPRKGRKWVVRDSMESFFLGETLKYLYLLFDPDSPVDLAKHVFNTEAHPTRQFEHL